MIFSQLVQSGLILFEVRNGFRQLVIKSALTVIQQIACLAWFVFVVMLSWILLFDKGDLTF